MMKFIYWFGNLLLKASSPCNHIIVHISEQYDRKLSLFERVQMHTHMKVCHCCTRYKHHLDNIHEAIIKKTEHLLHTDSYEEKLSLEASTRIKESLKKHL